MRKILSHCHTMSQAEIESIGAENMGQYLAMVARTSVRAVEAEAEKLELPLVRQTLTITCDGWIENSDDEVVD